MKYYTYIFMLGDESVQVVYQRNLLTIAANAKIEYIFQHAIGVHFNLASLKILAKVVAIF